LSGADQESNGAAYEKYRISNTDGLEKQPGRQDHVWQKERCQPSGSRPLGKPKQNGVEGSVEVSYEGADHNQHLQGDDEVHDDRGKQDVAR